jgi:protein SCO1/2
MTEIAARAGDEIDPDTIDLRLVTVSFDAESDLDRLDELARASGADGQLWRWAALAPEHISTVVGSGFRVYVEEQADGGFEFDQTFVLVDGWGVIRGEYQYATLASDADRIIRHIGVLEEEIRNSHGVASFAYEAAHVFLCYP